jgi:RhtB (resistance to homoserine/threonine) family protein
MFLTLVSAYVVFLLALMSPGPDFAVIVRNGVKYGSRAGMFTALGIALGNLFYTVLINIGIGALIAHSVVAFNVLKVFAAGYLIYIGVRAVRSQPYKVNDVGGAALDRLGDKAAFMQGLITNALNPKAAMFWLSYFSLVVDPKMPASVLWCFVAVLITSAFVWFSTVAWCLSREKVRRQFLRMGHWFDRVMGATLIALGVKVALGSR